MTYLRYLLECKRKADKFKAQGGKVCILPDKDLGWHLNPKVSRDILIGHYYRQFIALEKLKEDQDCQSKETQSL